MNESGFLVKRRVLIGRPGLLLQFAVPRIADDRHLRLRLGAVVRFRHPQRPQFGLNVLQLLQTLLVERLALPAHGFGWAAVAGQFESR